jgi:NADP-dependent 3-hydroxy acid dehydrogenase YdfG
MHWSGAWQALLDRGCNVVANSRSISKSSLKPSARLALVDGDVADIATAERVTKTAISEFGSIDHLINNAGVYTAKPFTQYSANDLRGFVSTNLNGFVFVTQLVEK